MSVSWVKSRKRTILTLAIYGTVLNRFTKNGFQSEECTVQ